MYRVQLTSPGSRLTVNLTNLTANADLLVLTDPNKDGIPDAVYYATNLGTQSETISLSNLPAGDSYYVSVESADSVQANYKLTITSDYAPGTFAAARDLGTLFGRSGTFRDYIGQSDAIDNYKLKLDAAGKLHARATNLSDTAKSRVFDSAQNLITTKNASGGIAAVSLSNLPKSTYFVSVEDTQSPGSNYELEITADYAGDLLSNARDLGTLTSIRRATRTYRDFVGTASGIVKPTDYYKFTVSKRSSLSLKLSGLDINTDVLLYLYDANGKPVASSTKPLNADELIQVSLNPGTYYFAVSASIGSTNYRLDLTI
jgi:hypothetical protein